VRKEDFKQAPFYGICQQVISFPRIEQYAKYLRTARKTITKQFER